MKKIMITPQELRRIVEDFTFDENDTLNYTDEQLEIFSKYNGLEQSDRIILALYAEYQSLRKVAKILGVSRTTITKQIKMIKNQIC